MFRNFKMRILTHSMLVCGLIGGVAAVQASEVNGVIRDPVSGKPVAAAMVLITETGLSTQTTVDGHFVLRDVSAGSYTLQVTVPGSLPRTVVVSVPKSGAVTVALDNYSSTLDKVIVVANRYEATRAQINADNTVSVLSGADLEHTAVHNAAEALGLLPGVNVMNTGSSFFGGIDGASRGEGMFTSVRGLNSEFNVNLINGVSVAQGMPYSRGVQLSLLPPSGLQTIVLNKTSTADMDGDAIGGTIDYRTPSAFDFGKSFRSSVTISGNLESRAQDYSKNALGGGLAADVSSKFGVDKEFGIYAGAYYDVRHYQNSEMGGVMEVTGDGAWARPIANADGSNPSNLDPATNLMSTGFNVGVSSGKTERYGANLSLDWRPNDTTSAYTRFTYARANTEQNSTLSQVLGQNVSYTQLGTTGLYQPVIGKLSTRLWYETNPEQADLSTLQIGGKKTLQNLTIAGNVFYSEGNNDRPNHIEISARPASDFSYGSSTLATYNAQGFPVPLLTPAMFAQLSDIASLPARRAGQLTEQFSGQKKTGFKADFKYDIASGPLEFIKFGLKYSDSKRDTSNRDWTTDKFTDHRTFGSLGIIDGSYAQVYPGVYGWSIPTINQAALFNLYNTYVKASSFDTCGGMYVNNYNCNTQSAHEAVTSAYTSVNLLFNDVEVVPGLRVENTQIRNTYWVTPHDATGNEQAGSFASNSTTYNVPLPSVFINYRPSNDAVYRGGLWSSYTRPAFVQLGGGSQINVSSDGTTTITQGNPNLEPIKSLNFDLSGEWDTQQGGHAMVAGFYKRLSNYIYDNGSNQVNSITSGSGAVRYVQPTNGGDGTVLGLEVAARQKFKGMPAPFDGMGIGGNFTRQLTKVDLGKPGMDPNERIQNAPDWMGNLQFFYEKNGVAFDLSYHATGAYVAGYDIMRQNASWDDLWVRPAKRLDLHLGYKLDNGIKLDLSVANLLKDVSYWSHIGKNSLALSDIVDSGRTVLLTMKIDL
jgi:TonB-dependent receptor